eukprot:749301-Hanusia_phi.AAC.3
MQSVDGLHHAPHVPHVHCVSLAHLQLFALSWHVRPHHEVCRRRRLGVRPPRQKPQVSVREVQPQHGPRVRRPAGHLLSCHRVGHANPPVSRAPSEETAVA